MRRPVPSGGLPRSKAEAVNRSLFFTRLSLFSTWLFVAAVLMVRLYWQRDDHVLALNLVAVWLIADGIASVLFYRIAARQVRSRL